MNSNYDSWKTTDTNNLESLQDECPRDCSGCPTCQPEESCPDTERTPSVFQDEFMHANPETMSAVLELKLSDMIVS